MKRIVAVFLILMMVLIGTIGMADSADPIKVGCIQDTSGGASSAGQPNE